jgi:hypothetical protein
MVLMKNLSLNCIEIEHYDIGCEFHVKAQCTLLIILCTIEKQDELISNEFFYSQL